MVSNPADVWMWLNSTHDAHSRNGHVNNNATLLVAVFSWACRFRYKTVSAWCFAWTVLILTRRGRLVCPYVSAKFLGANEAMTWIVTGWGWVFAQWTRGRPGPLLTVFMSTGN
jgi:hypothetical protein